MVQRWKPSWVQGRMIPAGVHPIDGYVSAADHARIVAEATAEARAAERRHWEARFRNAEAAHAAALAEAVRESAAHHYRMGKARGADLALNHDGEMKWVSDIPAPQMSANDAIGDILRFNIDSDAAAPRTLTADENYMRGLTDARAAVDAVGRWRSFPDDTLLSRAAVLAAIDALIHDEEATP